MAKHSQLKEKKMNGKKMTRALNRVAEPVKEESMWKGRASAEVLKAALVIVVVAG